MIEIILGLTYLFSVDFNSDNGVFSASADYIGSSHLFVQTFTLYKNTEVLYTKQAVEAHTFFLSDIGTVFACSDRCLYFYDPRGEDKLLQNFAFPNGFGFSADNHVFFASDRDRLCVYSNEGELINELKPCRLFAGIDQGKFIATVSTDTLFIYKDGIENTVHKLPTPYARSLCFSEDGNCIEVELPNTIEVIEFRTNKRQEH